MKKNISSTIIAISTVFLILFIVVPCHAEVEFEDWEGQWFKAKVTDKGLVVTADGTGKLKEKLLTYANIIEYDLDTQTYVSLLIQSDDEGETWLDPVPYFLKIIGGTPLDLVGYGLITPEFADANSLPIEMFAIVLSLKGKEKDGVLKKATVSTVGGCVIYKLGGNFYFAAGESFKGKSIPEDKVPDEVLILYQDYLSNL